MTVFVVAAGAIAAPATPALATSPDVVISEVYGGGGNTGAPWRNDYVELYNRSGAAVSLSGWSVRYASAAGSTWLTTNLTGSIAPGGYHLVQMGSGGGSAGNPLPTPDSTGTTNMSATSGKVALQTASAQRDLVGYGSANQSEGSPAPAGSNTTSVARTNPAVDTDNNAADFGLGRAHAAEQLQRRRLMPDSCYADPRHPGRGTPLAARGEQPFHARHRHRGGRQRFLDPGPLPRRERRHL